MRRAAHVPLVAHASARPDGKGGELLMALCVLRQQPCLMTDDQVNRSVRQAFSSVEVCLQGDTGLHSMV